MEQAIRARFGSAGLSAMRIGSPHYGGPFAREHAISSELLTRLGVVRNFFCVLFRLRAINAISRLMPQKG